jgi:hypothetical protein
MAFSVQSKAASILFAAGTDVMIFKIVSTKNLAFFARTTSIFEKYRS